MNRLIIIVIIVAIVGYFIWHKYKPLTRVEKIDWLNLNKGNAGGVWTKLTDEELETVFKYFRLKSAGAVSKVDPLDEAKTNEIIKRYAIIVK